MATHIFSVNEYMSALELGYDETINEGLIGKWRTKNKLAKMLAPTIATGKDIFKAINENVTELESIVDDYNDKLKEEVKARHISDRVEDTLSVSFDRALLQVQALIDIADVKFGSFTKDILLCNIVNYKIFIAPVRMAQIMSLGYQYYMAIVRQTLQSALITIELYSDTFFTMVRDDISGNAQRFSEIFTTARDAAMAQFENAIAGLNDESKAIKADDKSRKITLDILRQFKTISSEYTKLHRDTTYGGYRQNIFQEGGRNIEQLLRDNGSKELNAMAERFTQLGNKPTKDGDNSMIASYASAVKSNAEKRAYKLCTKINMNMMKIVKMFSLRSQDGLSAIVARLSEEEMKAETKAAKALEKGIADGKNVKFPKYKNEEIVRTKEAEKKEREFLESVGINLLGRDAFNKLLGKKGSLSYVKFLTEERFTYKQAVSIIEDKSTTVGDYEEVVDDNTGDKYWRPEGYTGKSPRGKVNEIDEEYHDIAVDKYGLEYNRETKRYDSDGDVHLGKDLVSSGKIVIPFGRVRGNFNCSSLGLVSLKNVPVRVDGNFNCTDNGNLESDEKHLYGCLPDVIKGKFIADDDVDTELAGHYYSNK